MGSLVGNYRDRVRGCMHVQVPATSRLSANLAIRASFGRAQRSCLFKNLKEPSMWVVSD